VDYLAGSGWHPLETSHGKAGAVICFESIFPQISRVLVSHGAKILFVLTNDGWFERTSAAEQHLQMSVYRAIENGRYVVRSTTTGISAVIAPDGQITSKLGLWKPGIMQGTVETMTHRTIYNRFGDWFAYMSAAIAIVFSVTVRIRRKALCNHG
jgi:apolipoprotein N-acyltransferase